MVIELGGNPSFDFNGSITHLVCEQIVRNEKILSCISCGLYVLRLEYIMDSYKAKKWLDVGYFCMAWKT